MNVLHIADLTPLPELENEADVEGEVEPLTHKANPLETATLPPEPEMLGNDVEVHPKILKLVLPLF